MAESTRQHGEIVTHHQGEEVHDWDAENKKQPAITTTAVTDDRETRTANHIHVGDAIVDVLIALTPLYFVGFCVAVYHRNGTLANSWTNQAIFQMGKLNPTIFPIIFVLIISKFIKAIANWKLEKGATVGHIQHLLGSRTLVSAIFTPFKLRRFSPLVPLLIIVWTANPLGGQLSLRAVSSAANITTIDTPYIYLSPLAAIDLRALPDFSGDIYNRAIEGAFNTALMSPATSKNGTQDIFGNVQIPMLEHLSLHQSPDSDGWYYTSQRNFTGPLAALAHAVDLPERIQPLYVSITGIPFKPRLSAPPAEGSNTTQLSDYDSKLQAVKHALFGEDVVRTSLQFSMESSYMFSNCTFQPLSFTGDVSYDNVTDARKDNFFNSTTGVVNNTRGFSIAYDSEHSINSTLPRSIGVESWIAQDVGGVEAARTVGTISEATCEITTSYVEAQVFCITDTNCSVAAIRESKLPNRPKEQTALDGISYLGAGLLTDSGEDNLAQFLGYANNTAPVFFRNFVRSTGIEDHGMMQLGPLESYFYDPESPFKASISGEGASSGSASQRPLADIGNDVFSYRLTQLLNTYWLTSVEPFTIINGVDIQGIDNADFLKLSETAGKIYVDKTVLRCHTTFMALLLVISLSLFIVGLITAYLDATRKGPDVLDQFVNSLRHNPYVHVDKMGNTMEDGQDMARRLRNTVVQMGDVQPDSEVGYVAIATPHQNQPVQRLDHGRHYV
ncbi:hypothetical protein Slin15195_G085940 [Septoria linicola]|uniref:Uncharacterized protein n=1 Tax=Septoria linicola TaxID=215465 RepID=A0A9Q9ELP3_9PEZI|nr:hypothetical protein Slin14017_G088530 [Septoria linicola]USW55275.1 hypothetical protein Slin15195_G085940 [Septoria linicola]